MIPTRMLFVAGCFVALLLGGCGKSSNDSANVRVLNLIQGVAGVNVTAGGTTVLTGATFESIGAYTSVGVGTIEFKVTVPGSTGTLVDTILLDRDDRVHVCHDRVARRRLRRADRRRLRATRRQQFRRARAQHVGDRPDSSIST